MTRALRIPAMCLALALGACTTGQGLSTTAGARAHPGGGGGGGARGDSAPARDSFTGAIISGTGAYSGARGRVRVNLNPRGAGRSRPTSLVVIGQCGASSKHCTELNGMLSGTLAPAAPRVPDAGHGFNLSGSGRVSPLGHTTVRGEVSGTGFIAHGHELMKLTLSSSSGSVTVQAHSGPVNGFSSP